MKNVFYFLIFLMISPSFFAQLSNDLFEYESDITINSPLNKSLNVDIDILNTVFDNTNYLIYKNGIPSINSIVSLIQGINLFFQPSGNVLISGNRFTATSTGTAITVAEAVPSVLTRAEVSGNTISGYRTSIRMVNINDIVNVFSNTINTPALSAPPARVLGIQLESCFINTVSDNVVLSTTGTTAANADRLVGISVELSPNTRVRNNLLIRMGSGIRCFGNMPASPLTCNIISSCHRGISLISATIGTQVLDVNLLPTPTDNQWIGTPFGGSDVFSDLSGIRPVWYWRNSPGSVFDPKPFTLLGISDFPLNPINYPFNCSPPCIGPACIQSQLVGVLQNNSFPSFINENIFL